MEGSPRFAQARVLKVAFFAPGATHEDGPNTRLVICGQGGGTLRCLVIGVSVHGENTQGFDRRTLSRHDHTILPTPVTLPMANSVDRVTCEPRRRRVLTTITALSTLLVTSACSTDGREMKAPQPNQVQTIIDETVPDQVEIVDTLPGEDRTEQSLDSTAGSFTLSAPWTAGGPVPADFTCSGDGVSPALVWTGAPVETQSFALVVTDLDALGPSGEPLVHWVVANVDPFSTSFPTGGAVAGAIEGINDLGRPDIPIVGWSPPCPPRGETHTYAFTLHAVSQRFELLDGTPAADLIRAIELASLASTTVTGTVLS